MSTNWDYNDEQTADPGRIHGYIRVSTREQAGDDRLSLSIQEQQIRHVASFRYPDREFILWSDPGQSALSIPLAERSVGKAMVEALRPGDIIICSKLDRLFRSMRDAVNQIDDFRVNGIGLIISDCGTDPIGEGPIGTVLVSVFAMVAQLEADALRQRTADGRAAKAARGGFTGGAVPIGFRKVGKGRDARLVEDDREQEMLALSRSLQAKGGTLAEIAAELNKRGFRSRAGTPIQRSQVYQWIQRERGKTRRQTVAERIRAGLAKRKAQGLPLGNPRVREIAPLGLAKIKAQASAFRQEIMPIIEQICATAPQNVTLQSICDELERRGVPTARGGSWYPGTVRDLLRQAGKSLPHPRYRVGDIGQPLKDRVVSTGTVVTALSESAILKDPPLYRVLKLLLLKKRGWSFRRLSREYGVERPTITGQFAKQRKIWRAMSPHHKRKVIVQLGGMGWSPQEIIEELNVSKRTVYRHLLPCGDNLLEEELTAVAPPNDLSKIQPTRNAQKTPRTAATGTPELLPTTRRLDSSTAPAKANLVQLSLTFDFE
jgi:site-specific DNA recombinase